LRELAAGSVHSRDTIANRMKEAGIPLRKCGRIKKTLKSKEDLYILVKAKRDLGLTYRKIAQDLCAQNIVCKTGSKKWHPMMIKRILKK
jgi:transposase InsO family protein